MRNGGLSGMEGSKTVVSPGRYADHGEAAADLRRLAGRVDGLVVGSQAELLDHADESVAAAGAKPVFASGEAAVEQGAVAGYVADDIKLAASSPRPPSLPW